VDDTNRREYEAAGSSAFQPYAEGPATMTGMRMGYYAVPAGVLENAPTLTEWAERAIAVAKAAKKTSGAKAKGQTPDLKRRRP